MSKSKGNPFCVCGHRRTDHQINYNLKTFEACLEHDGTACICKGFVEYIDDETVRPIHPTGRIKTPAFPFPSTAREVDTYLKLKDPQGALFG